MKKIPVGLLGCTGLVGQTYVQLLKNHPYFELVFLGASERSIGKTYGSAIEKNWLYGDSIPFKDSPIEDLSKANKCKLIFSALPSSASKETDLILSKMGIFVVTHGSYHRKNPLIPLVIPEINGSDIQLIDRQRKHYGSTFGGIAAKPNCSLQSYLLPLFPILKMHAISDLNVCTLQSLSGAGTKALSLLKEAQFIPFIEGEEEKSELEPLKILKNQKTNPFSAQVKCNRIPTIKGHFATVSFKLRSPLSINKIKELWTLYQASEMITALPSSPSNPLVYHEDQNAPLVKEHLSSLDMRIHIGQLNKKNDTYHFVALSDNMTRGAAGGGLQLAELAYTQGYIHDTNQSRSNKTSKLLPVSRN